MLYFRVILCAEYFIQIPSRNNSMITIQFLHYDMFWPLFLAIIKYYLYRPSRLSSIPPSLSNVFQLGEGHVVVYNVEF
jgi:hypothetical protein